jgi:DNA polymerase-3 subunit alpha (Gram-positive type)
MGIIAVDVETTGIDPEFDRIIEIGAFRPETGEVFRTLISPGRPLLPRITELTGITDEMLTDAPGEEEAIQGFLAFLGDDRILLGHNIPFDHSFLVQAIRRAGLPVTTFEGIDTLKIAVTFSGIEASTVANKLQTSINETDEIYIEVHKESIDITIHKTE